jgi:hypothetical protein
MVSDSHNVSEPGMVENGIASSNNSNASPGEYDDPWNSDFPALSGTDPASIDEEDMYRLLESMAANIVEDLRQQPHTDTHADHSISPQHVPATADLEAEAFSPATEAVHPVDRMGELALIAYAALNLSFATDCIHRDIGELTALGDLPGNEFIASRLLSTVTEAHRHLLEVENALHRYRPLPRHHLPRGSNQSRL